MDTVLEVQDGEIDLSTMFNRLDKKIMDLCSNIEQSEEEKQDGKAS